MQENNWKAALGGSMGMSGGGGKGNWNIIGVLRIGDVRDARSVLYDSPSHCPPRYPSGFGQGARQLVAVGRPQLKATPPYRRSQWATFVFTELLGRGMLLLSIPDYQRLGMCVNFFSSSVALSPNQLRAG
jgi:hypothetical protein